MSTSSVPPTVNHESLESALKARFATMADWESLSAREQTKRCCAEMLQLGIQPLGWEQIRTIIGKGSATDINRGKKEFFRENAQQYAKLRGYVPGMPDALASHVLTFWSEALALARQEYEADAEAWQKAVAEAEEAVKTAETERDDAQQDRARLQDTLSETETRLRALEDEEKRLQATLDAETAARQRAEQTALSLNEAFDEQRAAFQKAQEQVQAELASAIERLSGVEKYALHEIQRARSEQEQRVQELKAYHDSELARLNGQLDQLVKQVEEQQSQLIESAQRLQAKDNDCKALSQKLHEVNAALNNKPRPRLQARGHKTKSVIAQKRFKRIRPRKA